MTKIPQEFFAKVTYRDREGFLTQAYIDTRTGAGQNKHSDIDVVVAWNDTEQMWVQTDDWEWELDVFGESFVRKMRTDDRGTTR